MFTSGYVKPETILHFFYKITNERGTKTVFTYAHVKWFYGQSESAYYLNYFIKGVLNGIDFISFSARYVEFNKSDFYSSVSRTTIEQNLSY